MGASGSQVLGLICQVWPERTKALAHSCLGRILRSTRARIPAVADVSADRQAHVTRASRSGIERRAPSSPDRRPDGLGVGFREGPGGWVQVPRQGRPGICTGRYA